MSPPAEQYTLEHDWFDCPVPQNVQIGPRSWLYSTYSFRHFLSTESLALSVGNDTGIYNGTFFDLGPQGAVDIGNFCTIVGAIFATNRTIHLGDYVFVAHEVVIADCAVAMPWDDARRDVDSSPAVGTAGIGKRPTTIGDGTWICARASIIGPVVIGADAIVGAGAVVTSDVPECSIVAGNPAKVIGMVR